MHQESKKQIRVAVTGMGAVTALGNSFGETWKGLSNLKVGASTIRSFDASSYKTKIAYEVKDFIFDQSFLTEDEKTLLNDANRYALHAAEEALLQTSILNCTEISSNRRAVCIGIGMGTPDVNWLAQVFDNQSVDYHIHAKEQPSLLPHILARISNASGGAYAIHTACASTTQAIGEAYEMIASGERDWVLTGGADAMVQPLQVAGFSLLGALSQRNADPATACRPFDMNRDGLVIGAGACMIALENLDCALKRGANILGLVVGYGSTESAYRITDLHPDGYGIAEAINMAIAEAGISPDSIGYVNTHGTSTMPNDQIEAEAMRTVFHDRQPYSSSTKSYVGHMIAAAGAIEFAFCVQALRDQVLPPTINRYESESNTQLKFTADQIETHAFDYALSNSIGFGGSNAALVMRRWVP